MVSLFLPVATAIVTAIGTYIIAKSNNKKDNQQFFVSKMKEMFQEQQEEMRLLKDEIKHLATENYKLKIEILALREELQCYKSDTSSRTPVSQVQ